MRSTLSRLLKKQFETSCAEACAHRGHLLQRERASKEKRSKSRHTLRSSVQVTHLRHLGRRLKLGSNLTFGSLSHGFLDWRHRIFGLPDASDGSHLGDEVQYCRRVALDDEDIDTEASADVEVHVAEDALIEAMPQLHQPSVDVSPLLFGDDSHRRHHPIPLKTLESELG